MTRASIAALVTMLKYALLGSDYKHIFSSNLRRRNILFKTSNIHFKTLEYMSMSVIPMLWVCRMVLMSVGTHFYLICPCV